MEGYLKKYVNILQRWQERYFILNDEILVYCDKKGGAIKGQIHLKVSAIILVVEDPLKLIINTGTVEIHLKAATVAEKINWVNALKSAQEQCLQRNDNYLNDIGSRNLNQNNPAKKINDCLADIWVTQAQFDETLSLIKPKLEKQSLSKDLTRRLEILGSNLKHKITLCTSMLEQETKRIQQHGNENFDFQGNGDGFHQYSNEENGTVFESFAELPSQSLIPLRDDMRQSQQINLQLNGAGGENQFIPLQQLLQQIQHTQPIKYRNLVNNPVFRNLKFSTRPTRDKLPRTQDPKEKLNVWNLLKNLIGKDLTRFAVPVQLNEPLSMLQRLSEQLEYSDVLKQACKEQDSCLRMCYIMGFAVSIYAGNIGRTKKPFNPILGETYELVHKNFRFVSEQVSHHPPISAGYADAPEFEFWAHTDISSSFKGSSMEVRPQGSSHIVLKPFRDHFTFKKCITHVRNILFGEIYIDNVGEMKFRNHTTKDTGSLNLRERGWGDKGAFEMTGTVKDSNGTERYTLAGRWDQQLVATNVQTREETVVWKRVMLPPGNEQYYFFTDFAMQLNHLSSDMVIKLPSTDCRLRPDQQALELGLWDLAADEKFRLEEKQRARRNQMKEANQHHVARFFSEQIDPLTQERVYVYLQNYWETKNNSEGYDLF